MDDVVTAVGVEAVVDRGAGELGQHPGGVDRGPAAFVVEVEHRGRVGAGHVDPLVLGLHPGAGLIEMGHRGSRDLLAHGRGEPIEQHRGARQQRGQPAARDRGAEAVSHRFGSPLHRNVLASQQVTAQRRKPGPVINRRRGLRRERGGGDCAAPADSPLSAMLDRDQPRGRQVEHLPGLLVDHTLVVQTGTTRPAP